MNWYDQTLEHERRIRRSSFWAGIALGFSLCVIGSFILDYAVTSIWVK